VCFWGRGLNQKTLPIMPKVYSTEGVLNLRDLGGYATADGTKLVKYGKIIRSAGWSGATCTAVDFLVDELHVDTIFDLRTPEEVLERGFGKLLSRFAFNSSHPELKGFKAKDFDEKNGEKTAQIIFSPVLDRASAGPYLFRKLSCMEKLQAGKFESWVWFLN
jgi:hypothetical protein